MCVIKVRAQGGEDGSRVLKLEEAFSLAVRNSDQLKISRTNLDFATQQKEVEKLNREPGVSTEFRYGYISDAQIWNPSFSGHLTRSIPHQAVSFALQASQLIFQGGAVNNTIRKAGFAVELAELNLKIDVQDIKFLVGARYLDIFRATNQRMIFLNNIALAQGRLRNIQVMRKQGMVTENDVLRTKLIISDLELSLRRNDNEIMILNKQLNLLTGRNESMQLLPDTTLLEEEPQSLALEQVLGQTAGVNLQIRASKVDTEVTKTNVRMVKSEKLPQISFFASSNLQRPYTNSIPSVDIYSNVWQAGLALRYNLASLYQSGRKIKSAEILNRRSIEQEVLQEKQIQLAVRSSYIRYNQAIADLKTLLNDQLSARENYRVVEKKYFNQLALITDMIDAANTKIEAETRVTNARINIIYTYLELKRNIGTL